MHNFVDVEASGLGSGSYPIEVGVALADGSRNCTLICPLYEWEHWDGQAEALHGITREILLVNGRSALKVALMLNEWLGDTVVYSDAWGNDSCWLAKLYQAAGVRQRFQVESTVTLLTEQQLEHWHEAKDEVLGQLKIVRHRASNDAVVLQRTVALLKERFPAAITSQQQLTASDCSA